MATRGTVAIAEEAARARLYKVGASLAHKAGIDCPETPPPLIGSSMREERRRVEDLAFFLTDHQA